MRASELKKGMRAATVHGEMTVESSAPGPNGLQRVAFDKKVCICRPDTEFQLVEENHVHLPR